METPLVSEDGGDDANEYATTPHIDIESIESDAAGLLAAIPPVSDDALIENDVAAPPNQTEPNVRIEVTDEIESDAANSDSEAKYLEVTSVEDATPSESAPINANVSSIMPDLVSVHRFFLSFNLRDRFVFAVVCCCASLIGRTQHQWS